MKSSGSLRYFRNKEIGSDIAKYYETILKKINEVEASTSDFYFKYLETFCLEHFLSTDTDALGDSVIVDNPVYLNRTRETNFRLINIMDTYKIKLTIMNEREVKKAMPKVNDLILLLKKEYHLE